MTGNAKTIDGLIKTWRRGKDTVHESILIKTAGTAQLQIRKDKTRVKSDMPESPDASRKLD